MYGERVGVRTQDLQIKRNCGAEISPAISTPAVSNIPADIAVPPVGSAADLETIHKHHSMRGRHGVSNPYTGDMARGERKGEWRSFTARPDESFLYAIGCSGFIKIGVSDKPVQRMRDLQCASPHDMRIICLWRVAKDERRDIEAMAHELLRTRRIRNEWFRVTEEEAAVAGERAVYTKILSRGGALSESRPLTFINGELDNLSPLPTAEVGR